jgi:galactokinase
VSIALPSFEQLFGTKPAAHAQAPGRVNLMGDHTDYNGGFVLPAAIPQTTRVQVAPSSGRRVQVWSSAFPDHPSVEFELGAEARDGSWADYIKGMTVMLSAYGLSTGFAARIESDVPVGSGLSSSAALEIATGRALRQAFQLPLSDVDLARESRRAENEFVGAPVGIMDQMACSLASPSAALFLDTRSLEFERVPIPSTAALVVIDSGIRHRHVGGGYVERRRECEQAAALLGVKELRDAEERAPAFASLPVELRRRVRHVMSENRRVDDTVSALRSGDLERAGSLFVESHASLRDDFRVSIPEIDALVDIATHVRGVYGARLTGGGFGGAVVALASASRARAAAEEIILGYRRATGNAGTVVVPTDRASAAEVIL